MHGRHTSRTRSPGPGARPHLPRRGACLGADRRGRGLRAGRPRESRVPRRDPAQHRDVRPSGSSVRVLHLRDASLHERRDRRDRGGSAVLLRAAEPLEGEEEMVVRRGENDPSTCARDPVGSPRRSRSIDATTGSTWSRARACGSRHPRERRRSPWGSASVCTRRVGAGAIGSTGVRSCLEDDPDRLRRSGGSLGHGR